MRRANGTGSIYKMNDTKRRKPWRVVVNIGFDSGGRRLKKIIGSYEKRADAQRALELYNIKSPEEKVVSQITWGEVWELVKAERKRLNKPIPISTASAWKIHVSKMAKLPVSETKTVHMQSIVDKSGLAGATQRQLRTVFRMLYSYVIANDIAEKDYSAFVKLAPMEKSTLHKPFTSDEMQILWSNSDDPVVKIILIQCYTGMRPGEISKMETENVHLKERYMIGGSKTEAGRNRMIPIAECIAPFVKHFYHQALFKKSKYLIVPDAEHGVFSFKSMFNPKYGFQKTFEMLKMNHRPHDGRHTFITICDNFGISEAIQKRIVGHASGDNVTKDVYTHKVFPQLLEAVNQLPFGSEMMTYPDEENGSHLVATR